MVMQQNQRKTGSEYLTGQEVSIEEVLDVLKHRHNISFVGDNDIA